MAITPWSLLFPALFLSGSLLLLNLIGEQLRAHFADRGGPAA
jgi:ABC-type dipeptide/oligopeptide/nickel transport system permease subunit